MNVGQIVGPFLQGIGRTRIGRDSFHEGQSEIEQSTAAKYVGRRFSYAASVVPRLDQKTVRRSLRKSDLASSRERRRRRYRTPP